MSYHIVPARVTLRTSPMKDTFGDLFCAALKTFRFITDWHRKITARNLKTAKRNRGVTRASDPEPQQKKGPDTLSSYPILLPYPPTVSCFSREKLHLSLGLPAWLCVPNSDEGYPWLRFGSILEVLGIVLLSYHSAW